MKLLLYPLSLIYGLLAWLRNKIYDKGIYHAIEFSVPVISVGNLSTGGTGKTPHIEYLIRLLEYEFKVATMSRGYRRKTSGFRLADKEDTAATIGDEPMQFHRNFPEVYVTVCADRMAGIPELMSIRPDTEVILLDDAFQHRSVKPGLSILVIDYHKPFYEDYILPFGRLRESKKGYQRANIIVVSKCPDSLSHTAQQEMVQKINPLAHQKVFFSKIVYSQPYDFFTGKTLAFSPQTNLIVVSGIARPEPMLHHLRQQSANVHLLKYPDHHYFSRYDLDEIKATYEGWQSRDKAIIVSEKDAQRLRLHLAKLSEWEIPVFVLPIRVEFLEDRETFEHSIVDYVQREKEENQWM